jgi:hypothetical protein
MYPPPERIFSIDRRAAANVFKRYGIHRRRIGQTSAMLQMSRH